MSLPESRYLAQRLLTYEAVPGRNSETTESAAFRVCAKLRQPLITLAGVAGFRSLLSRALTLARAEAPSLSAVQVAADGSVQGLDELEPQIGKDQVREGGAILIAQLIGLLLTFIGEGLTSHGSGSVAGGCLRRPRFRDGEESLSTADKVRINKLPTGVPGLDEILGGGLPEFSFNIIAGAPGSGKTTLAHQIVFTNATPERPALYFTILGEPAIKMLRYQQQYTFFDQAKLNNAVRFINLSQVVLEKDLDAVLEEIAKEVEKASPGIVVVDSFRTVVRKALGGSSEVELQSFIQRLALLLTSWQATTFLVGEYVEGEIRDNPVFTVSDGLLWLYQVSERNSIVRKLQIVKLRGQASVPGLHTFRITPAGLQAFSRTLGLAGQARKIPSKRRLSIGIPELDKMLGGGIPEGDSVLVAGASGTGKSVLATQFVAEGIRQGDPGIVVVFEERPQEYAERASSLGLDLKTPRHEKKLEILYIRPLDLSVDETMHEILDAVQKIGAKRLVIDSLAGFEMALAPGFRADFRESLYRMITALTGVGVTILSTVEVNESFTEFPFSTYSISFLTDDIIRLRYVSIDGQLRKIMVVIKMRGGDHTKDIREYEITSKGVVIMADRLTDYQGLITGIPERLNRSGNNEEHSHKPEAERKS